MINDNLENNNDNYVDDDKDDTIDDNDNIDNNKIGDSEWWYWYCNDDGNETNYDDYANAWNNDNSGS